MADLETRLDRALRSADRAAKKRRATGVPGGNVAHDADAEKRTTDAFLYVLKVLEPLDAEARARVLRAACIFYEVPR